MKDWFNYTAVLQIIVAGLVIGAGLPALFSLGVRLNAVGAGATGSTHSAPQRSPVLLALSWAIFAVVLLAVIVGVMFVARDFIAQHTDLYLLGAKHKK